MSSTSTGISAADRARAAIKSSGRSQREIAALMQMDETKLSKSLRGMRRFTAEELLRLATAAGVTVRWIMGETDAEVSVTPPRVGHPSPAPESDEQRLRYREIAETAWRLFAERGFESVRIADIAEGAGVSSATVHYHFPAKQDLYNAAMRHSVKLAYDRQVAWLSEVHEPAERLVRLLELQSPQGRTAELEWSIWLQTWNRITVEGRHDVEYLESYRRWLSTVRGTIEDGQSQGVFRSGSSEQMAEDLTSLLDGYGIKVLTGVIPARTMNRRIRDFLSRCVLAEGPEAERLKGSAAGNRDNP